MSALLDANFNRATEALRVVEDYLRFEARDSINAYKLKSIRHSIVTVLNKLIPVWRQSRNISADRNKDKDIYSTTSNLIERNCSRVKESVRTLEEGTKQFDRAISAELRKIRFQFYHIEQSLLCRKASLDTAKLYLIMSTEHFKSLNQFQTIVVEAIKGGVDLVQFRDELFTDKKKVQTAKAIKQICVDYNIPLIINDRADICLLTNSDGLHLGKSDINISNARSLIGEGKIIGVTAHNKSEIKQANNANIDYISYGTFFASKTKLRPPLKQKEWISIKSAIKPIFAIGGIDASNINYLRRFGINKIVVSAAIMQSANPRKVASTLKKSLC